MDLSSGRAARVLADGPCSLGREAGLARPPHDPGGRVDLSEILSGRPRRPDRPVPPAIRPDDAGRTARRPPCAPWAMAGDEQGRQEPKALR
ncbi:hypothetical protein GCM10026982_61580 [Nocardiopsis aegyptia]